MYSAYLRLNEQQVNEEHDKVIFNVFVGKPLAPGALRQSHTLALGPVIGTTVGAVEVRDRIGALDANRHRVTSIDLSGCPRVKIAAPLSRYQRR